MKRCTINDIEIVNRIMTAPDIYPWISDDGSPSADEFSAEIFLNNPDIYVLQPNEYSIFLFIPFVSFVYQMHTCVLKEGRGKMAFKAARDVCRWMFENTDAVKLIGTVEENNRRMDVFARRIGAKKEGVLTKSYVKNGKISDLILFGMEKIKCQQQQ